MKKICVITTVHMPRDTRVYHREIASLSKKYSVDYVAHAGDDENFNYIDNLFNLGGYTNRLVRFLRSFSALRMAFKSRADLYLFHDQELIPISFVLRLAGKRVVYDAHEIAGIDILDKNWIPSYLRKPVAVITECIERFSFFFLSGLISPYPPNIEKATKRGVRSRLIMNFPRSDLGADNCKSQGKVKVATYVGNVTEDRGLLVLAEASMYLDEDINIHYIGPIRDHDLIEKYHKLIEEKKVNTNRFLLKEAVPYEEVDRILKESDIGLIPFQPTFLNRKGIPMKMFEYMAYGLPVVGSNFENVKKYVINNGCGVGIDNPTNPKEWALTINELLKSEKERTVMSVRARQLFLKDYNWDSEEKKLLSFCEEVISG